MKKKILLRFIDLFSGCGGLSLGLSWSGAQGLFAVEKDSMAFQTFKANFIDRPRGRVRQFEWPNWLAKQAWGIDDLLLKHSNQLAAMGSGQIDLIAGGPPCQGFSFAGRRNEADPRNQLFTKYLEVVRLVRPTAVLLENVPGMAVAHGTSKREGPTQGIAGSYLEKLVSMLEGLGYEVAREIVDAADFGVPQKRSRLIVVGLLRERFQEVSGQPIASKVFDRLRHHRHRFLCDLGLIAPVSGADAIGDLSIIGRDGKLWDLCECNDPSSPPGFKQVAYDARRSRSAFQRLMREGIGDAAMDSMRLARHSVEVRDRFVQIIATCRQGVRMNEEDRAKFKLKKHRIHPMSSSGPAPTITTLPDDVLHFSDPRILTVRECARLQSFPDWFEFKGKYTTGGKLRTKECPRYTQVGNAVPPLLGMALGRALDDVFKKHMINPVRAHATGKAAVLDGVVA